tara:strand:- start:257 stop:1123 length:867 start_codon:yes stop_codon:yes gene_type:complete
MKGVIILALGHPYWGRWAYNLAMSLKFSTPEVNISLLYAGRGRDQIIDTTLFDKFIEVPEKYYTTNGRIEYVKAKTALYKLTPYKTTICLDADTIWINEKPIRDLFNELDGIDFTMANRSFMDLEEERITDEFGVWASPNYIKKKFNFTKGRFYNLSSEMIYFKKDKKVSKLFSDAFKIYDKPLEHRIFNGGMPDELPFTISMIKNDIYPHIDNYVPFYWEAAQMPPKRFTGGDLKPYYAYSMGGHMAHPIMRKTYDNFVKFYSKHFNVMHPYLWTDKRAYMPERNNL